MAGKYTPGVKKDRSCLAQTSRKGGLQGLTKDEINKELISDNIIKQLDYKGLSKEQINLLKDTLETTLKSYNIEKDESIKSVLDINMDILDEFLATKRIENKSQATIYNYGNEIQKMFQHLNKRYDEITSDDIRKYMDYRKTEHKLSSTSVHNIRMFLMSFFKWLFIEEKITKNPMDKIGVVKREQKVVEYLTDEELEMIRCSCTNERDLAIVDILSGSGMRVSELCGLNISDVDFDRGEMKVMGKGSKERICYLTGRAKVHLRWYLDSRKDDNPALFVSTKKPYNRLTRNSIEFILHKISENSSIPEVRLYPHKFRKTFATTAIQNGADVSMVQRMTGHSDVNILLKHYTNIASDTVKVEHHKYIH